MWWTDVLTAGKQTLANTCQDVITLHSASRLTSILRRGTILHQFSDQDAHGAARFLYSAI